MKSFKFSSPSSIAFLKSKLDLINILIQEIQDRLYQRKQSREYLSLIAELIVVRERRRELIMERTPK